MSKTNDSIMGKEPVKNYFVGCIQDNTFWSYNETTDKDKAIERASKGSTADNVEWCVYEQVITYNKIASFKS